MVDHVFPQQGDPNDAENFAAWLGRKDLSDYVEFGFTITPDFANNEFDISDGKAHVFRAGSKQASNFGSPEDRFNLSYYGYLDSRSGVSLPNTNGLNNVFVELNLDTDDNPEIVVNDDTTTAYSSESALQIATVDTSNSTVTEINRIPAYGVPSGAITMWNGTTNDIPAGWTLCDGTGGGNNISVPDLQDKFVVGAGNSYSIGDTGGEDQVSLSTTELPSHDHGDGSLDTGYQGSHDHGSGTITADSNGGHTHGVGGDYSHDHGSGTLGGDGHIHNFQDNYMSARTDNAKREGDVTVYDDPTSNNNKDTDSATVTISGNTGSTTISISETTAGGHSHNLSGSTSESGGHSHGVSGSTSSTGGGSSHENRPSYYSVAYIMKL